LRILSPVPIETSGDDADNTTYWKTHCAKYDLRPRNGFCVNQSCRPSSPSTTHNVRELSPIRIVHHSMRVCESPTLGEGLHQRIQDCLRRSTANSSGKVLTQRGVEQSSRPLNKGEPQLTTAIIAVDAVIILNCSQNSTVKSSCGTLPPVKQS
jgi:hypothetical protein